MSLNEHGLSYGISRINNDFFMNMKIVGKLTHADYEMMIPMLENSIKDVKDPNIKIIVDMTDFEGWEMRAAWDDLKLGIKHNQEFSKIALIDNKKWEEVMAKVSNWFIGGEIQYFENRQDGLSWLDL
jgi:hypothetical protein